MKTKVLSDIFYAAVSGADPYAAVKRALHVQNDLMQAGGEVYDLHEFDRVLVIGAGKAVARMALAAEEALHGRINTGLIVVKYGHTVPLRAIEQIEAAHPLPDAAGVRGTDRILEMVRGANNRTLIICLLSGGGSALLISPRAGISLAEKQKTTDLLLRAGAPIAELNAVRKHLSSVKGGRLAAAAYPAKMLTLILSDVVGDALDVIASGPTAPDRTTFADAAAIVEKYRLRRLLPQKVVDLIDRGVKGLEVETAKSMDPCFEGAGNMIIGSISLALAAARERAARSGLSPQIVTAELRGEARDAARALAQAAVRARDSLGPGERRCLLFGGETTVTVRGKGTGGRNQELALAFAVEIQGVSGITLLSAGTDGIDGPTDAAGAVVDGETAGRAREAGIDPLDYLERNDSYSFFKRFDSVTGGKTHFLTGQTGTNVMDVQIICVEKDRAHKNSNSNIEIRNNIES